MTLNQNAEANQVKKSFLTHWLIAMIKRYQNRGGGSRLNVECNFIPSCSHYTKQAIEQKGVLKGLFLGFKRIKRCNHPDLVHKIEDPLV